MSESVYWVLRARLENGEMIYFEEFDGDFVWTTPCRQDAKSYFDFDSAKRTVRKIRSDFRDEPSGFALRMKVVRVTVRR